MLTILCWVAGYLGIGLVFVLAIHVLDGMGGNCSPRLEWDDEVLCVLLWPFAVLVGVALLVLQATRSRAIRLGLRLGNHEED
jgi:hypothetical protein